MFTFLFTLFVLMILFGVGFKLTGALLKACLWLFIFLPFGIGFCAVGVILCCTILLIPVGTLLMKGFLICLIPTLLSAMNPLHDTNYYDLKNKNNCR